jgi:purine-binding chemotaxis protein CheW
VRQAGSRFGKQIERRKSMADEAFVDSEQHLVVFDLAQESYGVDIAAVHEIIRMQHITAVPRAPAFVEGVINLRGKVIPVVDLRMRFGLALGERGRGSRIVVVDVGHHTIGIVVDGVSEVLLVPASAVVPPSPVVTTVDSDYLKGIAKLEDRLIILLALDRVLQSGDQSGFGVASSYAA